MFQRLILSTSDFNMQRTFLRYFILLLAALVILSSVIVAKGLGQFPAPPGPRFDNLIDTTHSDTIAKQCPDAILLGNSMVGVNVDTAALSNSLGKSLYPIVYNGSASALWYLSIKNNILASPCKPRAIIVLFRDTILTVPQYNVNGNYVETLDTLAHAEEHLLIERAYVNFANPFDLFAQRYLPPYRLGNEARIHINNLLQYFPPRLFHCDQPCVDANFQKTFNFLALMAPRNIDAAAQIESSLYSERALDFHGQVEQSFLPEIIRMCRENGVHLILVRGKTVYFDSHPKPAALDEYMRDLKEYLSQNKVSFEDLELDTHLTAKDFADPFHVFPEARSIYTQMLVKALSPLLP